MHNAAAVVWIFLLKWSLNWQFEGRRVSGVGASSQPTFSRTPTAAQQAAIHQLKYYVEDFVRGSIVPCEELGHRS